MNIWQVLAEFVDWVQGYLPPTVSPLEVAWTVPLMYGVYRFGGRWIRTDREWRALIAENLNGPLRILARKRWVMHACLFLAFEMMAGAGVLAMTVPQSPSQDPDSVYFHIGVITTSFFFSMNFVLTFMGEFMDRSVHALHRYYNEERDPRKERTRRDDPPHVRTDAR